MFGRGITLFHLSGFAIRIDASWIFLALLITWSLGAGFFPLQYPEQTTVVHWIMGVAGAVGLFVSIILHELGHALVARRYGIQIKGITLFIFGGVAHLDDEPPSAKSEFLMAVAGPAVSVLLALGFGLSSGLAGTLGLGVPVSGVLGYLGVINAILVLFNLVPAFPLDGGRVLRSALWAWQGSFRRATRIAANIGGGFGFLLIFLGIAGFFTGNFIGGLWWFLIGLFLRGASQMSYQHALVREALAGEPVERFMKTDPVTVSPSLSLEDLVENHVYRYHHKTFPVVEDGKLVGCVTTRDIRTVPREQWQSRSVGDIVRACDDENTVDAGEDAIRALRMMSRADLSRLIVTAADGRLAGIVALKDLLRFLAIKLDLEGDENGTRQLTRQRQTG